MEKSIKTRVAESKRIIGLAKLTICIAVILSLVFTANVSAGLTTTFTLDADSLTPGEYLSPPLVVATTLYGNITFEGEIKASNLDIDFLNAGASGNSFDILGPDNDPCTIDQWAKLSFDFDVISVKFIYGGNYGGINIEARDGQGNMIVGHSQADTTDWQPAGPVTLSGSGIRSLYWRDPLEGQGYAALDDIIVTVDVIPSPSALVLAGIGVGLVSRLRKHKIV